MKLNMGLFRSLLPLHNPIGFGPSDFVEFGFALLLIVLLLTRSRLEPAARRLARYTGWCMLALGTLVVLLRLALLPLHPVPTPSGADDFSYLLSADTFAHFRLTNPTHPLHQFFETTFVLQQPSYSSIYPIGQGLFLALGQLLLGLPWAGVMLSAALFCALCYWMLRGWLPPGSKTARALFRAIASYFASWKSASGRCGLGALRRPPGTCGLFGADLAGLLRASLWHLGGVASIRDAVSGNAEHAMLGMSIGPALEA